MEINKSAPIVRFNETEIDGEVIFQQLCYISELRICRGAIFWILYTFSHFIEKFVMRVSVCILPKSINLRIRNRIFRILLDFCGFDSRNKEPLSKMKEVSTLVFEPVLFSKPKYHTGRDEGHESDRNIQQWSVCVGDCSKIHPEKTG